MELAISTCYDYSLGFEENLEHISRAGFKTVSLGGHLDHSHYHKPEARPGIQALVDRLGLRIDSIHAPFGPTTDLTPAEEVLRHSAIVEMKRAVEACKELDVKILILHLHSYRTDDVSSRMKRARESISELLDVSSKAGVKLAVENLPGDNSLIILKFVLDILDDPMIGLCFDNGHAALSDGAMELLDKYRGRLFALHLHDNDGRQDLHQLPFEGTCDLPNLAAQLNKVESICPITVESEVTHSEYKTPEAFLKRAFETATRFQEMLKS